MIKYFYVFALSLSAVLALVSCASSPESQNETVAAVMEEKAAVTEEKPVAEEPVQMPEPEPEPLPPPEPEKSPVYEESDEEYARSTAEVTVSREEFSSDKKEILQIISELSTIMEKSDYDSWLEYISPDSVKYWSDANNLAKAARRLPLDPKKPLDRPKLNNLKDYFRLVFVRSRKGRSVNEIRYISRNSVKAVQVEDERDIVYYNFVRVNQKWMVSIPKT
ncbi:MAG: hypothetical protein ACTTKL_10560 [Treponema sp.]